MDNRWKENEELNEEEELTVTSHRDKPDRVQRPEDVETVEVPEDDNVREALEELGEDISSSPARRGHQNYKEADAPDELHKIQESQEESPTGNISDEDDLDMLIDNEDDRDNQEDDEDEEDVEEFDSLIDEE